MGGDSRAACRTVKGKYTTGVGMKVSRNILGGAALAAVLIGGLDVPASAATKAGDACKKVGQTKSLTSNKGELVCLKVAGARTWVYVPLAESKAQATNKSNDWRRPASLPNEDSIRHFAASSDSYINERLAGAQQTRDQLSNQFAALEVQRNSLQSEISSLPGKISQAQSNYQQAQSALDEPKRAYTSAASQAAVLNSQYSSAYSNRVAYIGCKTLEMFGYRAPGDCGVSNDSYYFSIKAQYEAAQARADSLYATYSAKYNDYKAKYDEYKRLYDRQAAAQSDLNATNAELGAVNAILGSAEAHLKASHDANGQLQALRAGLARWDASTSKLEQLAGKKLSANWEPQYQRLARLFGITQLHRASVIDTFANFRSLTGDLPDPQPAPAEPEDLEGESGASGNANP